MATNTANLGFRKPEVTDLANVTTDIADNFEKWDDFGDMWTQYTPQWKSSPSNPTLGNGTLLGFYRKLGKTLWLKLGILWGSTTSMPTNLVGCILTLPAGMAGANTGVQSGRALFIGGSTNVGVWILAAGGTELGLYPGYGDIVANVTYNYPHVWGAGHQIQMQGVIELA